VVTVVSPRKGASLDSLPTITTATPADKGLSIGPVEKSRAAGLSGNVASLLLVKASGDHGTRLTAGGRPRAQSFGGSLTELPSSSKYLGSHRPFLLREHL